MMLCWERIDSFNVHVVLQMPRVTSSSSLSISNPLDLLLPLAKTGRLSFHPQNQGIYIPYTKPTKDTGTGRKETRFSEDKHKRLPTSTD
jgi:hypothetical protein